MAVDGFRVLAEYLASAKRALKPLRVREAELHAAARPRQILILYNYIYSPNRLSNYLFDESKKKVEFLAAT